MAKFKMRIALEASTVAFVTFFAYQQQINTIQRKDN